MSEPYLAYLSNEYLFGCIENIYAKYEQADEAVDMERLFQNKLDIFKLSFDSHFNELSQKQVIEGEILRQTDKSVNNAIGIFHEEIMGGIQGFERGNKSGYDIKAKDNSLFAEIKNKHNTVNSSSAESLFQKLERFAGEYPQAQCYWVQIIAKGSFQEKWEGEINGKEYAHDRVWKISGDRFYELLTGRPKALFELYEALPQAIEDFLSSQQIQQGGASAGNVALLEIQQLAQQSDPERTLFDQIAKSNLGYYQGFEKL